MKVLTSKWLVILIYLMIFFPVGLFVVASATLLFIRCALYVVYGSPIDLSSIEFIKILKGSIAGGEVGAIGCWWIYFRHYNYRK